MCLWKVLQRKTTSITTSSQAGERIQPMKHHPTWMTALKKHVLPRLLSPFTETQPLSTGELVFCGFSQLSFLVFLFWRPLLFSFSSWSPIPSGAPSSVFCTASSELSSSFSSEWTMAKHGYIDNHELLKQSKRIRWRCFNKGGGVVLVCAVLAGCADASFCSLETSWAKWPVLEYWTSSSQM